MRLHDQILQHELKIENAELKKDRSQLSMRNAPFSISADLLVGRDAELARLHQAWSTAQDQGGAIALIEAEAGGGKTRLAQEFGRGLSGALCLTGQCYESTRTAPYRPWIDLLQARLAQVDRRALAQ